MQQQIATFLAAKAGRDYCDECLAAALGISRDDAENHATRVATSSRHFLRDLWTGSSCGRRRKVSRARVRTTGRLQ